VLKGYKDIGSKVLMHCSVYAGGSVMGLSDLNVMLIPQSNAVFKNKRNLVSIHPNTFVACRGTT